MLIFRVQKWDHYVASTDESRRIRVRIIFNFRLLNSVVSWIAVQWCDKGQLQLIEQTTTFLCYTRSKMQLISSMMNLPTWSCLLVQVWQEEIECCNDKLILQAEH